MKKPAIKAKALRIMNHVYRHRGKYAVLTTAMVFMYLQSQASKEWTEFMVEKGIDPMEFFVPEYFAELNS